ncbi:MAG: hypothetical protein GY731_18110, partial [Gammaproteobacteria bacterium]|nr:hypothetical protein [Gammaproteobacteria bacterium]
GEQVFEPFMTTRSGGTGLGLAVVRAIVQSHGGAIRLDARQEQGAAFTIELPVTTAVHSNSSPVSDSSTSPAVVDHQLRFKPGQQGNQ